MNTLLKKEMRLSALLLTYLFIGFAFMTLLPGYPILCGVFFITLGIYQSFQSARESNDIVFSALLPSDPDDRPHDDPFRIRGIPPECSDECKSVFSRDGPADFRYVQPDFLRRVFQDGVQSRKAFCNIYHHMLSHHRYCGGYAPYSRTGTAERVRN